MFAPIVVCCFMVSNSSAVSRGLQQDRVADADFADVVQGARPIDVFEELLVDLLGVGTAAGEFLGEDLGVGAHPDEVVARLRIAQFGHLGQGRHRHVVDVRHEAGMGLVRFVVVVRTATAGPGNGLQGAAETEMEPDPGAQFVRIERFDEVIVGTCRIGPHLLGPRRSSRDHDHLDCPPARARADAAAGLVAVDAGHHDVEHDQVGGETRQHGQGLFAAAGLGQAIVVLQQATEHSPHHYVVVNDQDFFGTAVHDWSLDEERHNGGRPNTLGSDVGCAFQPTGLDPAC